MLVDRKPERSIKVAVAGKPKGDQLVSNSKTDGLYGETGVQYPRASYELTTRCHISLIVEQLLAK